ncbi:MAG TPA: type II secretion system protein [Trueperaceae bacterium]|nr:type II secretion system protein [Trueperaceae bacterium]
MKRESGLTLIETLVALLVFGVVATIATSGVVKVLHVQATNEAATSAQAKLRRVTEVFTQELRSAVLGGVTNAPYASGSNQISFLLLDGGAGYQVLPHDSGQNSSFVNANNVDIATGGSLTEIKADLEGSEVLMVNDHGDAVILLITNITQSGGSSSTKFSLKHPACPNTIDFTSNTLIMSVKSLGLSFDAASGNLFQRIGAADPVPLAFDMDGVTLEYVYEEADGTPHALGAPLLEDGSPARESQIGGAPVTLARVQMTVSASEGSFGGREISRSYTGQVEMSSNPSFQIDKVVACG